jgi:hypothetical protein
LNLILEAEKVEKFEEILDLALRFTVAAEWSEGREFCQFYSPHKQLQLLHAFLHIPQSQPPS